MARTLTLFTWGYYGWGPYTRQLLQLTSAVEAARDYEPPLFVDIRVRRSVRAEGFNDDNFERLARKRYLWMRDLGNQSIIDGGNKIRIRRPAAAEELLDLAIERARERQRIIFFCSCELPCDCHRTTVAGLVLAAARRRRKPVEIVEWPGGEVGDRPVQIEVPAENLRKCRKSLSRLTLSRNVDLKCFGSLPVGTLVTAVAPGEVPVSFAAAAIMPSGDTWYLPVLWNGSIVRPRVVDANRWRRVYGYATLRYRPAE